MRPPPASITSAKGMPADSDLVTNLLLVDDQPQNLMALEAILEPLGQKLWRAHSGAEALKLLLVHDFAAILLDVQMPGIDGFETAALIKERERSRHIPIIFLTAISKDQSFVFKGYTVGAVDYISKPFEAEVLRAKVLVFIDLFRKSERIKQQAELIRQRGEQDIAELKRQSEQRYRNLAESMPQIVWTADAEGRITYVNQRWFECAGVSDDGKTPRDLSVIVHPEDAERFQSQWSISVRERIDWEGEFRFGAPSRGRWRWHLVRAVGVRDATGEVTSWVGTSTDIDERRRTSEALRFLAQASEALATSLDTAETLSRVAALAVPGVADGCLIDLLGEAGGLRRVALAENLPDVGADVLSELFPLEATDGVGPVRVAETGRRELMAVSDASPGDAARLEPLRLARVVAYACLPLIARQRVLGVLTLVYAGTERRPNPSDLALIEDLARRIAVAVDNAHLYMIAESERAKLVDAHRAKDEFLATLSHELRTPLNSMLGWIHLVRGGSLDAETVARGMETIERNTRVQAQLIGDLLDISRIVTGKLHVEMREVDIRPVLEAAVDAVRLAADARSVELTWKVADDVAPVWGDADRLQQVAWNLLSNAVKFTPSGGRVRLSARQVDGSAVIEVSDSGQGIAPDFLPHVFERFRQADGKSTRQHGGLGLGLAIVNHLVLLHGGEVSVASEGHAHGSTFTVRLPTMTAEQSATQNEPPETLVSQGPVVLAGIHVLVVDDEPDGREMLRAVLERQGARVTAVSCASEALEAIPRLGPDVLLCDIGLPGEDGYSLIRRVRELGKDQHGDIPAAALTAYASLEDRDKALSAGFQAHVAKPVEPRLLTPMVASLFHREEEPQPASKIESTPIASTSDADA